MSPRLRKFTLTAHVTASVGWLGAVVAYLVLAIIALTSQQEQLIRAAYLSLEVIGWFAIVPLCVTAVITGLIQSLGTEWGLFRHYWIVAKFVLTIVGTTILLVHMQTVNRVAALATEPAFSRANMGHLPTQLLIHAGGGLLVLLTATTLSIYKPWGRTPYGRRKQNERRGKALQS